MVDTNLRSHIISDDIVNQREQHPSLGSPFIEVLQDRFIERVVRERVLLSSGDAHGMADLGGRVVEVMHSCVAELELVIRFFLDE